jgi:hypothetical protein
MEGTWDATIEIWAGETVALGRDPETPVYMTDVWRAPQCAIVPETLSPLLVGGRAVVLRRVAGDNNTAIAVLRLPGTGEAGLRRPLIAGRKAQGGRLDMGPEGQGGQVGNFHTLAWIRSCSNIVSFCRDLRVVLVG